MDETVIEVGHPEPPLETEGPIRISDMVERAVTNGPRPAPAPVLSKAEYDARWAAGNERSKAAREAYLKSLEPTSFLGKIGLGKRK